MDTKNVEKLEVSDIVGNLLENMEMYSDKQTHALKTNLAMCFFHTGGFIDMSSS